ncbi:nucleotide disphospho-sugar-binding domain-containing protein [Streptomyces inhibens]|uniref:nucleotide disphospho-sugar-binding domain-containing protein n=1 Tax=Streptomyces inhibens TaxID=2293571 RepID=UPI001EE69B4B|nr:nucleotide disphospho-sugar-binding domain-containing protein [Streptomyces inhibens]UKY51762.1 DUF1205 domain-containing protein [Streptomyces inhibens]
MRVLMLSTPYPSHFTPLVPFAWALRAAGHEVLVAAQPDVVDVAREAGLCTVTVGDRFHGLEMVQGSLAPGMRLLQMTGRMSRDDFRRASPFWGVHARYLMPRYAELADLWKPDLIVSEQMEFAGSALAAARGIPSVQHRWAVDPLSDAAREHCREYLDGVCRRMGLDGYPDPTLLLDPCPPSLQLPDATPGRPIRQVAFNGTGTVPEWAEDRRAERRVCVCLGRQVFQLNGVPLFRSVIEACDGLVGTEAVVMAPADVHEQLGPVPDAVRLVSPAPLGLFLDSCDAVVHHGGANTAMTTIGFGLPQLVLPQLQDQFIIADQLAEADAAIVLDTATEQDSPATVHAALGAVLGDPRYGRAARALAREMAEMPLPAEVLGHLSELVASHRQ